MEAGVPEPAGAPHEAAAVPGADCIGTRGGEVRFDSGFEYLRYLGEQADRKALLTELMNAYGKDVWNFAFSMTKKWDQADDIAQEVFLKAYRNLHTFRSQSSVKTWLLAITRNMVLDYAYFIKCNEVIKDEHGNVVELRCTYDPETKSGSGFTGPRSEGRSIGLRYRKRCPRNSV